MTRRLVGGPSIGGPPYSDSDAVAAMQAFEAYGSDDFRVPAPFTSPTLQSYRLVTTPVLEAGTYHVSVGIFVVGSAQGTDVAVDIEFDGVPLGTVLTEAAVVGGGFVLPATQAIVWADGTHTIEYFVGQPSSPGMVTAVGTITTWGRKL